MALQIANLEVVEKIERLARTTGLTKTALVECAIDRLAREIEGAANIDRFDTLLAQLDRIPDRVDAYDPLSWDA